MKTFCQHLCSCRIVSIHDPSIDPDQEHAKWNRGQPSILTEWAATSALWVFWASAYLIINTSADDWNGESLKHLRDQVVKWRRAKSLVGSQARKDIEDNGNFIFEKFHALEKQLRNEDADVTDRMDQHVLLMTDADYATSKVAVLRTGTLD